MQYWRLKRLIPDADRGRVVRNLTALRAQLDREIPAKDAESELLLATWNLRDFGKTNRRGFGKRSPESFFYIAEVLSRFDFVAVQEVNELDEWEHVMDILGRSWEWIATDVTDEGLGGNGERLTYLYDTRKVDFRHVAGELVLPADLLISSNVEPKPGDEDKIETTVEVETEGKGKARETVGKQFRRTPFAAIFQAAWFKFEICTVHIYYGKESGQPLKERIEEIGRIAEFFGGRADKAIDEGRSLILLGDFNIVGREHKTMQALTDSGFEVPPALREAPPTNADQDKFYDQIAFKTKEGELEYLRSAGKGAKARAGSVNIFENVYTPAQRQEFKDQVAASSNSKKTKKTAQGYYEEWRTYQFSDHAPLWVRLRVNDSESYLEQLAGAA